MPCDFDEQERLHFKLVPLANQLVKLIKGKLFDTVCDLRTYVRNLTAAYDQKVKHDCGQTANTQSTSQLLVIESRRDDHIREYEFLRGILRKLEILDEEEWPKLTIVDTFRKSTEQRHQPGSSQIEEGTLWNNIGF
ncbi:hypothetical protein L218DRAFT_1007095 [Marasmius fiardii PR-910]|nr:hypothetical protein L218DRAFT_1007095 [Marasmius fiardii PR-910]